jgi:hypothetical protein
VQAVSICLFDATEGISMLKFKLKHQTWLFTGGGKGNLQF